MRQLMSAEMAARGAAIVTLVASIRFHTRVRQLMGPEMAALGATIVALVAGKRFLVHLALLNPRLVSDLRPEGRSLAAKWANN